MSPRLTEGRLLARNSAYNLLAQSAPLLAAVIGLPILVRSLGTERFGILGILWAIEAYTGILDLGLGKALTKSISDSLAEDKPERIRGALQAGLLMLLVFSGFISIVLLLSARFIVSRVLTVPESLRNESVTAMMVLALSVPPLITISAFRAVFAAYQRFDLESLVRIPIGVMLFLGPIAMTGYSCSVAAMALALTLVRTAEWLVRLMLSTRMVPGLLSNVKIERGSASALARFGGWVAVTNATGRMLSYCDRWVIGATLSMTAVTYYVTPFEIAMRLKLIPASIMVALFPALVHSLSTETSRAALLVERGSRYLILLMFPVVLFVVVFADEGLTLWLGHAFATSSAKILQWLAVGVLVNSVADARFETIQAVGRVDAGAMLLLVESPFYFLLLVFLLRSFGVIGAAIASLARMLVQTAALYVVYGRVVPGALATTVTELSLLGAALVVLAVAAFLPDNMSIKIGFVILILVLLLVIMWVMVFSSAEKSAIKMILKAA